MTTSERATSANNQRAALITGANKGIGFHVARKLGTAGVRVLIGSRDEARGAKAVADLRGEGLSADLVVLDVTNQASINAALTKVKALVGVLDILVNNAGIAAGNAPPSTVDLSDLRKTYETNVFGVVAVTNAFLPLLRGSSFPRIVNVSSGLGSLSMMSEPSSTFNALNVAAYQSSKSALDALTLLYAKELKGTLFKVNAICPGFRATDLGGEGVNASLGALDPAGGADIVVRMALLGADGPSGAFFADDGTLRPW